MAARKKPTKNDSETLTARERMIGMRNVARTTFRAAPSAVVLKLSGSLVTALVPLATAYFAAQTTTALAAGFGGDSEAGSRALLYVLVTAALGVFLTIWNGVTGYIDTITSHKIEAAITDELYERFLSLRYELFDDKTTADRFDKAQRFAMFFSRFFNVIASIFGSIVQVVASLLALWFVSWWIALILIIAIIPSVFVQLRLSRLQAAHWRENTEVRRKKNGIQYQVFEPQNLAELRVYGLTRTLLDLFKRYRDQDQLDRIKFEKQFLGKRLLGDIIEAIAEVVALFAIARQIIDGIQPIGQFILVQQMVSKALAGMHSLASQYNSIDEDLASMVDYELFMKLPVVIPGENSLEGAIESIEVSNLTFRYPNTNRDVLKDVSFTVHQGQHIAIVGENGAGKSTLVKLLLGLYQPTEGAVRVNGVVLQAIRLDSWYARLGVLQQEFLKYRFMSVEENVVFGDVSGTYDRGRYQRALAQAEASSFVDALPRKHETLLSPWYEHDDGTKGVDLSGGQWQRVALARNFYRDAEVIILDEPTSAIDALAESRIFKTLFESRNKIVIAISHRLSTVRKADKIIMVENGEIVEVGTYAELVEKRGKFYTMFESQILP